MILEEEYLEDNPWLESFMKQEKIYLVRPDRYIFGSTDSSISLDQLIDDLKNRLTNQKNIEVDFSSIKNANHFFKTKEEDLKNIIDKYIKNKTELI